MGNLCGRDYEVDDDVDEENESKDSKQLQPIQEQEPAKAPEYSNQELKYILKQLKDNKHYDSIFGFIAGAFNFKNGDQTQELMMKLVYGIAESFTEPIEGQPNQAFSKLGKKYSQGTENEPIPASIDLDLVTQHYAEWMYKNEKNLEYFKQHKSVEQAFKKLPSDHRSFICKESAYEANQNIMDADAMARIAPMIIFGSKLKGASEFRNFIYADLELTHSNKLVQDAVLIYAFAIKYILKNPGQEKVSQKAFQYAYNVSQSAFMNIDDKDEDNRENCCSFWLMQSLKLAKQEMQLDELYFDSDIEQAFILVFYYMLTFNPEENSYEDLIDDDQECNEIFTSIFGAAQGAILGFSQMPGEHINSEEKIPSQSNLFHKNIKSIIKLIELPVINDDIEIKRKTWGLNKPRYYQSYDYEDE